MREPLNWLLGGLALGTAALVGNLAPSVVQSHDVGLTRELASQRALLSSLNKKVDAIKLPAPAAQLGAATGTACDTTAMQATVEASVREALSADRRDEEEAKKDSGVSPDSAQIYAKAEGWLNTKLASKRWASSDDAELQRASIGLSPEQRFALRQRVLKALNSGELRNPRFD